MKRMFNQLGIPENLKRQVALPNTGDHVLADSPIKSKDVKSVRDECEKLAVELLYFKGKIVIHIRNFS